MLVQSIKMIADFAATNSTSKKLKVGASLLTKDGVLLITSYNHNIKLLEPCEDAEGNTQDTVLHAEVSCLLQAAKSGLKTEDLYMYVTHTPCFNCTAAMIRAGIRAVLIGEEYKDKGQVDIMKSLGMEVEYVKFEDRSTTTK